MTITFLRTYDTQGGQRQIVQWPMDVSEARCEISRLVIPIPLDRHNCAMHDIDADACPAYYVTPPECQHEPQRLDPGALPAAPRCLDCGLEGADVTDGWRARLHGISSRSPLASEGGGSEVMLGNTEPDIGS